MKTGATTRIASALVLALGFAGLAAAENDTYRTFSGETTNLRADIVVGRSGVNNTLEINMGAQVTDRSGVVGLNKHADRNFALVTGANTLWNNKGDLCIGEGGSENRMIAAGGAQIASKSGCVGDKPSASDNLALITGWNSAWTLSGSLSIGDLGSSNRLSIANGAAVNAASVFVGAGCRARDNLIDVSGGGSLNVSNARENAPIWIGNGGLLLDGGVVVADRLLISGAGWLTGQGTVSASTTNAGLLCVGLPVGVLEISPELSLRRSSSLEFEIGGLTAGAEYDQLIVAGPLTLGGRLRLIVADGFVPKAGDQFEIITAGAISGSFRDVCIKNCPVGLKARATTSASSVVVEFLKK